MLLCGEWRTQREWLLERAGLEVVLRLHCLLNDQFEVLQRFRLLVQLAFLLGERVDEPVRLLFLQVDRAVEASKEIDSGEEFAGEFTIFSPDHIVTLLESLNSAIKQLLHARHAVDFAARLLSQHHLLHLSAPENALIIIIVHRIPRPEHPKKRVSGLPSPVLPVLKAALKHQLAVVFRLVFVKPATFHTVELIYEVRQVAMDSVAQVAVSHFINWLESHGFLVHEDDLAHLGSAEHLRAGELYILFRQLELVVFCACEVDNWDFFVQCHYGPVSLVKHEVFTPLVALTSWRTRIDPTDSFAFSHQRFLCLLGDVPVCLLSSWYVDFLGFGVEGRANELSFLDRVSDICRNKKKRLKGEKTASERVWF